MVIFAELATVYGFSELSDEKILDQEWLEFTYKNIKVYTIEIINGHIIVPIYGIEYDNDGNVDKEMIDELYKIIKQHNSEWIPEPKTMTVIKSNCNFYNKQYIPEINGHKQTVDVVFVYARMIINFHTNVDILKKINDTYPENPSCSYQEGRNIDIMCCFRKNTNYREFMKKNSLVILEEFDSQVLNVKFNNKYRVSNRSIYKPSYHLVIKE